jgi:hypothetical protein
MALEDFTKRVVLSEFRADTHQASQEIDRLIASHNKLKESAVAAAKAQAQHFDQLVLDITRSTRAANETQTALGSKTKESASFMESAIGTYAKAGLAIGAVAGAASLAAEAFRSWSENVRLEAKTAGINIDVVTASFSGLISHHEALQFAAQTSTGVLALNQGQMETVGQAAVALRNRGFDLTESLQKLTDAAVKGKVGGLDDLGLAIKEGSSKAETLRNMMTELNKVIADSGTPTTQHTDAITRLGVAWDNAKDKAKSYVAEGIMDVIDGFGMVSDAAKLAEGAWGASPFGKMIERADRLANPDRYDPMAAVRKGMRAGIRKGLDSEVIEMPDDDRSGDYAKLVEKRRADAQKRAELMESIEDARSADRQRALEAEADRAQELDDKQQDEAIKRQAVLDGLADKRMDEERGWHEEERQRANEQYGQMFALQQLREKIADDAARAVEERRRGYLEAAFGTIEEIDLYKQAFESFGGVFTAFGDAVGGSYEAIVTGSGSAAAAFKHMLADGLLALGKSEVVQALKETALGFGELALGNAASAALHFKSAAVHGAVAVAAGAAAHGMGAGSSADKGAGSGASGGTGASRGSSGGGSSGNTVTQQGERVIVYAGDSFSEDTPRYRQRRAEALVGMALGPSSGSNR